MTAKELAEVLARWRDLGDLAVVLETAQGGCPTRRMVDVASVHRGFDWSARLFMLTPAEPVVVVRGVDDPWTLARERLEKLKSAHGIVNGGGYIPKAREPAWIDGFIEGVRAHVTACERGDT